MAIFNSYVSLPEGKIIETSWKIMVFEAIIDHIPNGWVMFNGDI